MTRAYWQKQHTGADFEAFWRKSLHDGWIEGTTTRAETVIASRKPFIVQARGCSQRHRAEHPPRSHHLRRPILQQRLAAGIAQADDQAHLGQRHPDRPQDGRAPADRHRRTSSSWNSTARKSKAPSGFRPAIPITPSPSPSAMAAPRRRVGTATASTLTSFAPVPRLGSPPACKSAKPGTLTSWPRRKACRAWTRPAATIARWSAKPASRNTAKIRFCEREGEEPNSGSDALQAIPL